MYEKLKALLKIQCGVCKRNIKLDNETWGRIQRRFDKLVLEAVSENEKHDS